MIKAGFNGTSSKDLNGASKTKLGLGEVDVEFAVMELPALYPDPGRYTEIETGEQINVIHPKGIEEYADVVVFFTKLGDHRIYNTTPKEFCKRFKLKV